LVVKQQDGLSLFTKDSWSKHLERVKQDLFNEVGNEKVAEILTNYSNSFQISPLNSFEAAFIKKNFCLQVNENGRFEHFFGNMFYF